MFTANLRLIPVADVVQTPPSVIVAGHTELCSLAGHVTSSHGCVYTTTLPPVSAEDSLFFLPASPSSVSISFSRAEMDASGVRRVYPIRDETSLPSSLALLPGALFSPSIHLFQPHPHLPRGQFSSPSLVFKSI